VLNSVLQEIEAAGGVLNLDELSGRLGVERGALEGMIQFWVRKGRLKDDDLEMDAAMSSCGLSGACGNCPGPANCAFVMKMPKSYSLVIDLDQ